VRARGHTQTHTESRRRRHIPRYTTRRFSSSISLAAPRMRMMGASNDGTSSLSSIFTPSSPENLSGRIVNARLGTRESIPCCRPDGAPPLTIIPAGEAPPPPHMVFLLPLRRSQRWWWGCGFGETKAREQRQGIFILRGALEEVAVAQCGVRSVERAFSLYGFGFLPFRPGQLSYGEGWGGRPRIGNAGRDVWDSVGRPQREPIINDRWGRLPFHFLIIMSNFHKTRHIFTKLLQNYIFKNLYHKTTDL
jgi:hypothetical protein